MYHNIAYYKGLKERLVSDPVSGQESIKGGPYFCNRTLKQITGNNGVKEIRRPDGVVKQIKQPLMPPSMDGSRGGGDGE